jgi:hypothetical protein
MTSLIKLLSFLRRGLFICGNPALHAPECLLRFLLHCRGSDAFVNKSFHEFDSGFIAFLASLLSFSSAKVMRVEARVGMMSPTTLFAAPSINGHAISLVDCRVEGFSLERSVLLE